jgi:hypothetical protein
MKTCTNCKTEKDSEQFYKQAGATDGLDPYCKDCRKDKNKQYAKNNYRTRSAYQREYYIKNKGKK